MFPSAATMTHMNSAFLKNLLNNLQKNNNVNGDNLTGSPRFLVSLTRICKNWSQELRDIEDYSDSQW